MTAVRSSVSDVVQRPSTPDEATAAGVRTAPWAPAPSRGRWLLAPLGIFVVTRVLEGLLLAHLGRDQAAFVDGPGSRVVGEMPASPGYPALTTNWDGQWFHAIADHGYPLPPPIGATGGLAQSEWAYYPLYPALCRVVMVVTRLPFAYAAMTVSLLASAFAICLLHRMLATRGNAFGASLSVLALCTYPSAVVLQTSYSEGVALLGVVGSLFLLSRRRYGALCVAVLALSLTRPVSIALLPVVAVHWWARWHRRRIEPFPRREQLRCAAPGLASIVGFALWPTLLAAVSGRPTAYLELQSRWHVPGSTSWLGELAGRGEVRVGVVAAVACATLLVVVGRRSARRVWPLELRAWAVGYGVFMVVSTRPISSTIRLAMLAVVPWWPAPVEKDPPAAVKVVLVVCVGVVGLALSYAWIDFYYVGHDASIGYP